MKPRRADPRSSRVLSEVAGCGRDADLLAMIFEPGLPSGTGPKGQLGETVAACFPLPMVWTGINFV